MAPVTMKNILDRLPMMEADVEISRNFLIGAALARSLFIISGME